MFKQRRERAHALLKGAGYSAGGATRLMKPESAWEDGDEPAPRMQTLEAIPERRKLEPMPTLKELAPPPEKRELAPEYKKRELRKAGGRVGKDDGGGVSNDLDAGDTGMKSGGKTRKKRK